MRVLIATGLYPPEVGGPATYVKTLETELPQGGVGVVVVPFSRARHLPKVIRHIAYFFILLREGKQCDIIFAQDPVSVGLPAWGAAFFLGKKFLLKVVGDYAWEQATQRFGNTDTLEAFQKEDLPFFTNLLRSLERFIARRAARVIVPSKYLSRIVKQWGVDKKKLVVIHNGMDVLADAGNKPVLRGLIKFHGTLIISIGRLVPWKGFRELIRMAADLKRDFPDLKLMIVGNGPDLPALEEEAAKRGMTDDVIFTGALPRDVLLRYVRASDLFILNTRYEGFSHQILEVMAVGIPVITTRIGGNPEVIEHEKNGYLTAPNDTRAIEGYAKALLSDAGLRASITAAAKRTVRQFSNERMAGETIQLLRELERA